MSYNVRVGWKDHIVERPRTYTEVLNGDGSKTFTAAPGEILQQGTPQSATNFNHMDEALQHVSIAYDLLQTTSQAIIRAMQDEIADYAAQLRDTQEEVEDVQTEAITDRNAYLYAALNLQAELRAAQKDIATLSAKVAVLEGYHA